MISLKNILFATTKAVAENFTQDVYIEDNNTQGFVNIKLSVIKINFSQYTIYRQLIR